MISLTEVRHLAASHISLVFNYYLKQLRSAIVFPVLPNAYRHLTLQLSSHLISRHSVRGLAFLLHLSRRFLQDPVVFRLSTTGETCCQMHGLLYLIPMLIHVVADRVS